MAKTKEENLVEAVEKYPCLYNFKIPEYARRDITDNTWSKVAEEVKETGNNICIVLLLLVLYCFLKK